MSTRASPPRHWATAPGSECWALVWERQWLAAGATAQYACSRPLASARSVASPSWVGAGAPTRTKMGTPRWGANPRPCETSPSPLTGDASRCKSSERQADGRRASPVGARSSAFGLNAQGPAVQKKVKKAGQGAGRCAPRRGPPRRWARRSGMPQDHPPPSTRPSLAFRSGAAPPLRALGLEALAQQLLARQQDAPPVQGPRRGGGDVVAVECVFDNVTGLFATVHDSQTSVTEVPGKFRGVSCSTAGIQH